MRFFLVSALLLATAVPTIAQAQHAVVAKRNGVPYRLSGFGSDGCGPRDETCTEYVDVGVIVSVSHDDRTGRIDGFTLRTRAGHRIFENIDAAEMPATAGRVIRIGRRVKVTGTKIGQSQIAVPDSVTVISGI